MKISVTLAEVKTKLLSSDKKELKPIEIVDILTGNRHIGSVKFNSVGESAINAGLTRKSQLNEEHEQIKFMFDQLYKFRERTINNAFNLKDFKSKDNFTDELEYTRQLQQLKYGTNMVIPLGVILRDDTRFMNSLKKLIYTFPLILSDNKLYVNNFSTEKEFDKALDFSSNLFNDINGNSNITIHIVELDDEQLKPIE